MYRQFDWRNDELVAVRGSETVTRRPSWCRNEQFRQVFRSGTMKTVIHCYSYPELNTVNSGFCDSGLSPLWWAECVFCYGDRLLLTCCSPLTSWFPYRRTVLLHSGSCRPANVRATWTCRVWIQEQTRVCTCRATVVDWSLTVTLSIVLSTYLTSRLDDCFTSTPSLFDS